MNRRIPCFAWLENEQTTSLFGPTILFAAGKTLRITKYLYISKFWVAVHDNTPQPPSILGWWYHPPPRCWMVLPTIWFVFVCPHPCCFWSCFSSMIATSSYPGWIKSPHVVTCHTYFPIGKICHNFIFFGGDYSANEKSKCQDLPKFQFFLGGGGILQLENHKVPR